MKKDKLLGVTYGKADRQLKNSILFDLVKILKKDICFRCNKKIESIDELSIEHKIAWQSSEKPIEYFYDLGNITFSHRKCNRAFVNKKQPKLKDRNELLGVPFTTADSRLKKSILFQLVKEAKKDICYRCENKIEKIESLSVEHKKPWLNSDNPKELFYNLDNIAFSHLRCNVVATTGGRKTGRIGKSGYRGVWIRNRKTNKPYRARIWGEKKFINLGDFPTAEEARDAYEEALKIMGL